MKNLNVLLIFMLSLSGCTTTLEISPLTTFTGTDTKVADSIALYVSPETRQYMLSDSAGFGVFKMPIGLILQESAINSFQTIFHEVTPSEAKSPDSAGVPTLSLEFAEDTWFKAGATTVSKSTVRISLQAILFNSSGKQIWTKVVTSETAEGSKAALVASFFGAIGGAIVGSSYEGSMKAASQQALGQALQTLNNELIANRDILKKL